MTYIIDNPLKGALVSLLGTSQNLDNQHRYMVIIGLLTSDNHYMPAGYVKGGGELDKTEAGVLFDLNVSFSTLNSLQFWLLSLFQTAD